MEYQDLNYEGAIVKRSLFTFSRKEAHAYVIPSEKSAPAARQIKCVADAARRLAEETGLRPAFMRWLLSDPANQMDLLPKDAPCAVSAVRQPPLDGSKCALLLLLEEDADYRNVGDGMWLDGRGKLIAGDDRAAQPTDSRSMTVSFLEKLSEKLTSLGGSLKDNCLRTWLFVRDIDNNYKGVVQGRNEVFAREGLTPDTHFIASTGIEGSAAVPAQTVLFNAVADLSVAPRQVRHLYGKTHLNPTYEYGVAFERGTAVDYADRRHVYISGTASIDNKGQIVAPGDIKAQTERMLENITVLLAEAGCGWDDVAHMTVYLRDIADHAVVSAIINGRFPKIPKAIVLAPVCRPGWLVETECMAIKKLNTIPKQASCLPTD